MTGWTGITPEPSQGGPWDKRRLEVYREFIGGLKHKWVLDVGVPNWVGRNLAPWAENTLETDFDYTLKAPRKRYDVILDFEVLEHLMNPLKHVQDVTKYMGTNSVLYLSTPIVCPFSWYHSPYHFTEYKLNRLMALFEKAGLEVKRYKVFRNFPWWLAFTGVRPLLRVLFLRCVIFELRKV